MKDKIKELEKADSITQSCIFDGSRSAGKSYRQCLNWLEDYKSRNKKAIEYNKQIIKALLTCTSYEKDKVEDMLYQQQNILQGVYKND